MHKNRASTRNTARSHPRARLGARSCRLRRIADVNGALLKDGLRSYEFDAVNRLAAMTVGAVDSSPTTRYVHNALGQLLFKTEPQFPPAAGDEADPAFFASLLAFFSKLWGGNTGAAAPSPGPQPMPNWYRPATSSPPSYTGRLGAGGDMADGSGALTGGGRAGNHPSVPNAVETLIDPGHTGPFVPGASSGSCVLITTPAPSGMCPAEPSTKLVCGPVIGPLR